MDCRINLGNLLDRATETVEIASRALDIPMSFTTVQDRENLLTAARGLVEKLEGPEVGVWRVLYGAQSSAVLQAAYTMNLFGILEAGDTAQRLSEKTGAEKLLIVRLMRALISLGIFKELGEELYDHNSRSELCADSMISAFNRGMLASLPFLDKFDEHLAHISFKNPDERNPTLFQYAMKTDMNFFQWLYTQPQTLELFSTMMAANTARENLAENISALIPRNIDMISKEALGETTDPILIVDIGGGRGLNLNNVRELRPELKGRMIVQDLPQEIEGRTGADGVEGIAYDFFTPQPLKDSYIYYFRHVLHDWSDNICRDILKQTIPAMKRGYSKLIIVEAVLPNVGASVWDSMMDISMMPFSGLERTEMQWRELLTSLGLEIVNIRPGGKNDYFIEAVLPLDTAT